jgi:RNA polymerase sigma-70 factor, ECF subfamily
MNNRCIAGNKATSSFVWTVSMDKTAALGRDIVGHLPRLRRFCRALTGTAADADDLAQAAVEKAMRNVERYEPGTNLDRWLITIAHNHWRDDRRSARVRAPHVDVDALVNVVGEDGAEDQMRRDTDAHVRAAVAALPDEQRQVVALVLVEGFAYREAAEMLGLPIGTVMSRLSRARAALAARLTEAGVTPCA